MIWVERGWLPALGWNLPDEFAHPDEFALTSDRAQFILEAGAYSGGYSGYGFNPSRWVQYRNMQGRRPAYSGYGASWDELANRVTLV